MEAEYQGLQSTNQSCKGTYRRENKNKIQKSNGMQNNLRKRKRRVKGPIF